MKLPARIVAWMLPLFLTACFHKTHKAQVQPLAPPVVAAPQAAPAPAPAELPPPPVVAIPVQPAAPEATAQPKPKEQLRPPVKQRHKPAPRNTQQASNGTPGVSAIGQLSSGNQADFRRETENSIAATERGLNCIHRSFNDQEQKTVAHIRGFLKQARTALASGDVDGAHTLASKAKVLLSELSH
jgi:hypothetical protein